MENREASLAQIRNQGIEALVKALGPVGMARFLQQFDSGSGDYTRERGQWLQSLTVQDVLKEIKIQRRKAGI